jgi:FkbM family methyltransferase
MNVRPIVLAVVIVGCTVLGWIIGKQTLLRVDESNLNLETGSNNDSVNKGDTSQRMITVNKDKAIFTTRNRKLITKAQPTMQATTQNIQQTMRNVVPTMGKKSLKVYSRDLNNWNLDNNVCKTNTKFQRAWLKTTIGNTPIYIHNPNDDIWISKNLLMNGHWEADFVSLVFNLLLKDNAHDIQFVDLGANIGVFTLAVAKLGVKVIAVEPLSINLQRLCKSVEEGISEDGAPFADRVTIIHNALSDVRENVQLGKDQQNVGGTYVLKDSNERKVQGSVVNGKYNDVVMTAKLDDLLQLPNFDFKKVILKIDVEGYESKVFNGGQAFFNTVDVQAVLMEWRWHKGAKDIQSLLDFFTSRKYKPFNPKQTNPTPLQISDTQKWPGDVLWKK